jgi:hypothetical protein
LRYVESKRLQSRFQQARATNTLAAYRSFVESYGNTDEGEKAANEMSELAYSIVENAKSETEVDRRLEGFLDMEPVRRAASRKKSAIAYNALMENPSPKACREYLKKYPGSDGYSAVLAMMDDELNQEFEDMHTARQFAAFAIENSDNPLADEDGYIYMPNVNNAEEQIDLLEATRAYEANLTALSVVKAMAAKGLEIGKG